MVVVDASVLVDALLIDGPARARLADANIQAPDLIDAELLSVLRRLVLAGRLPEQHALRAFGRGPWNCVPISPPTMRSMWPLQNSWAPPCSLPTPLRRGLPACFAPWK